MHTIVIEFDPISNTIRIKLPTSDRLTFFIGIFERIIKDKQNICLETDPEFELIGIRSFHLVLLEQEKFLQTIYRDSFNNITWERDVDGWAENVDKVITLHKQKDIAYRIHQQFGGRVNDEPEIELIAEI